MTDLRNAVEDRLSPPTAASFNTRPAPSHMGYGSAPQSSAPMPAADYYQSRWDQLKDQRWFPMAVVGGVVLLFGLFIAYAYNQGANDAGVGGTAPVIAAADEPFKTAPTDAGGMVVPNQDTLVFDQIAQPAATATADGQAAATETLVPPPEAPLVSADDAAIKAAATETPAATTATAPVAEATQPAPATTVAAMTAGENATKPATTAAAPAPTTPAAAAPAPAVEAPKPAVKAPEAPKPVAKVAEAPKAVAAPKPAPAPKAVAPTPAPAPVAQTKPAVLPPVATTPAPAPAPMPAPVAAAAPAAPAPTPVASSGTAKVQLGAFGSEAAAKAAWQTFQQKYGAQLAGVTPNFARADLGAKGVVYRVQGVGLSAASATSICQAINAQAAGGCIVAK